MTRPAAPLAPSRAHRSGVAMLCLCLVSGCTLGPDYARPKVSTPAAYRFDQTDVASAAMAETPAWWNGFGDEALDKLIRECIANNRDLRIATARVDEFAAVLTGTQSQGLPQVGYGLSASRQRASKRGPIPFRPGSNSESSSYSVLLSASWEIDLWGRIRRETEAARANLFATEEARRGVVLTLVSSVISSYLTLLDLDSRLRVAEATVAGRKESVRLFQERLNSGYISEFEMSQVRAEYEGAVAAIPDLKRAIGQQENALSVLLGRNPGPIQRSGPLENLATPTVPGGLPADLLARRPDILAAEQQLIASNAQIGAARALYFPQISLTGSGGFASTALENLFDGPAHTWSFAGSVLGPIFAGGAIRAANRQAEARYEGARASYELSIQNAFRDVEDALVAVRETRDEAAALQRQVATLTRGVELARDRYDNGYANYIDVLDTERSLFAAQLAFVAATGDSYRALVSLYTALGGDWIDYAASGAPPQSATKAGG